MKKDNRLRDNRDFLRVYRRGRKVWNRHFNVYYLKHKKQGIRVGFSVTTKYGNAVERNRIKRQLREIVRLNLSSIPEGIDMVILPKNNTKDMNYHQLEDSVNHLLNFAFHRKK